jgi:hypothetical protein
MAQHENKSSGNRNVETDTGCFKSLSTVHLFLFSVRFYTGINDINQLNAAEVSRSWQ